MRILVTSIGSSTATAVADALLFTDDVVGTDCREDTNQIAASEWVEVWTVPHVDLHTYIPKLIDHCVAGKFEVIIPIYDKEVELVALHRHRFEAIGTKVLAQPYDVVRLCNDKLAFSRWAYELGLGPWVDSAGTYPVFVKPRFGTSSRGITQRVDNQLEIGTLMQRAKREGEELIVQQYLEGREFTLDVLADLDGNILDVVCKEKLEARAGLTYRARTTHHEEVENLAESVALHLGAMGPLNVQIIDDKDLGPKVIEVNPRFSSSLPLTVAAGLNSPEWYVKQLMGETVITPVPRWREGVVMRRYWAATFVEEG